MYGEPTGKSKHFQGLSMELLQVMVLEVDATNEHWIARGRRIEEARRAADISQETIAREVGLSQTTVSDICLGKLSGKRHLAKIAKILGVTEEWLRTGRDPLAREANGQAAQVSDLQARVIEQFDQIRRLEAELAAERVELARVRAENVRLAAELAELQGFAAGRRSPQAP